MLDITLSSVKAYWITTSNVQLICESYRWLEPPALRPTALGAAPPGLAEPPKDPREKGVELALPLDATADGAEVMG